MTKLFSRKHVAARFGITPAARYATFLDNKQWKTADKKWSVVPSYEKPMQLAFTGDPLESFFTDEDVDDPHPYASEVDFAGGWVPLATIGREEAQFLVARATDVACPVAMWEHETGEYVPCAESLDAFLAALGPSAKAVNPPKSRFDCAALRALADELEGVRESRASKKRTAALAERLPALQAMLAAVPPLSTMSPDDATAPGLAYLEVGRTLQALGRLREAVDIFKGVTIHGQDLAIAPALAAELLVHELDDPEQAIAICEAAADPKSLRHTWALALFRLGNIDAARQHLEPLIERQVSAALKLDPRKDRASETARSKELLATKIASFAAKHALDATPLLAKLA